MSVGTLTVELQAATAKFQADLGKAAAQAEASARRIERSMNTAFDVIKSKAVGLIAVLTGGFSIGAFVEIVKGSIDAEEALGRIGARAGLTGEQLSTMSRAARLSHTDLEDVASMSARLSKALIEANDASTKSATVLKALGINSSDAARLLADPAQAVFELAKRINDLPEGGTKAAAQLLILGKAGGTTSAFLEELAKQTGLVVSRTREEIAAAKDFNDKLTDMSIRSGNVKTALANALLPTLSDIVDALVKLTTGSGGAQAAIAKLAADGSIKEWAQSGVLAIATVAEALIAVGRIVYAISGSFKSVAADIASGAASIQLQNAVTFGASPEQFKRLEQAQTAAQENANKALASANKRYEDLWNERGTILTDALRKQFAISESGDKEAVGFAGGGADSVQRRIDAAKARAKAVQDALNSAARLHDDPTKKIIEERLKAIDASIELEKKMLAARDEFAAKALEHGDISLKESYARRQETIDEQLGFERSAYADEVEIIKKAVAGATTEVNRAEFGIKLVKAFKDLRLSEQEAAKKTELLWLEARAGTEAYANSILALTADILDLQGETAKAAKIRLGVQDEAERRRYKDDPGALAKIGTLTTLKGLQADFNELQQKSSDIYAEIAIRVARIDLAQQYGGASELQTLAAKSEAGKSYINVLRAQAEAELAIARASGDPKLILQAEQMKLKLDELAASADILKKKFDDVFTSSLATFFEDIIGRTKSLSQAVRDMAKNIEQSITKLVAEDLSKRLYKSIFGGGDGGGFDLGSFFAKLLGTAAPTAPTANFGAGDSFGGGLGGYAIGTDYVPRDMIAKIHQGEAIVPAALNRPGTFGRTVHIHQTINVLPGATRESASQAAAAQYAETRRALAREL